MLLINRFFSNEPVIWCFVVVLTIVDCLILNWFKKLEGGKNKRISWIILCFLPVLICLIHFLFFRIKGNFYSTKYFYSLFYISGLICAFFPLILLIKKFQKIILKFLITFCILANLHTVMMPLVYDSAMRNHSFESYTKSFISTTKDMEKYYSLKEWKHIDIPALRDKFMPVIEEAERTNDEGLLSAALTAFSFYFYDGHVSTAINSEDVWLRTLNLLAGHDYGLSLAKLNDGKVVAINVEEGSAAYESGIRNTTLITRWNGQPIEQALEEVDFIYFKQTLPVKSTEDMLKPFMLATKGMHENGEKGIVADLLQNASITEDSQRPKAMVGFIDADGVEKEITLDALGGGINRFEMAYILMYWKEYMAYPELKNLETVMINEDTAYMLRYKEQSSVFFDILSYFTNHAPNVKRQLIKELTQRREEGMKNLIIDARNNSGGFWALGLETASLFTTKDFDIAKRGSELFGKKMLQTVTVEADGRFSDIQVYLLVDMWCVSAGDSLVKMLSQCPNVHVIGLTPSNCSCQETGGLSFLSNGICNIVYPVNWLYELDGSRYIDTDETRECTLPLDIQIPFTYELIQDLYDDYQTRDVILDYVVDYIKK